ncbi:MAG: SOS response-associated peptidase [Verrucomicrobiota bacterium]
MCCRYSLKDLATALAAFSEQLAEAADAGWTPRYNVAPTQRMPVVIRRHGRTALETMRFGLLPPARRPGEKPALLPNARAETLLDRSTFREAAGWRRGLVPADGFYEWEQRGPARRPHYFTLKDRRPFFFAGLWEPAVGDAPASFCIVTTTPNSVLSPLHDRMPVMLGPNSAPAWLGDRPLPPAQLARLCRPLRADLMTSHRVDPRVNSVHYEAPDCVERVPDLIG